MPAVLAGLVLSHFLARPLVVEDRVAVIGDVSKELQLSVADLAKFSKVTVSLGDHEGNIAKYTGVAVRDILAEAGVTVGDNLRGSEFATYIVVEATDKYKMVFGLGELEPAVSGRTVILAYEKDGKSMAGSLGTFRLVVKDDKKQARCVRMVATIRVNKL